MSKNHGPRIVTNGLKLCLESSFVGRSYPGSGYTWYDLSGQHNDGSLINGASYINNAMVFDGTNDRISVSPINIYQKSYSIVSQGLVDQILQNSPVERKRFFDEATGIRQYQIKKENALKKIDRSHENLKQASIALAEIKPRLNSLTRQINRLEKSLSKKSLKKIEQE